jgi:hypothetical protein
MFYMCVQGSKIQSDCWSLWKGLEKSSLGGYFLFLSMLYFLWHARGPSMVPKVLFHGMMLHNFDDLEWKSRCKSWNETRILVNPMKHYRYSKFCQDLTKLQKTWWSGPLWCMACMSPLGFDRVLKIAYKNIYKNTATHLLIYLPI